MTFSSLYISDSHLHKKSFNTGRYTVTTVAIVPTSSIHLFVAYLFTWSSTECYCHSE